MYCRSPPGLSSHSPGNPMVGSPPPPQHAQGRGAGQGQQLDELADCFAGSFAVTNTPNDTNRPHPRFAQYKMKSSGMSQVRLWRYYYQIVVITLSVHFRK